MIYVFGYGSLLNIKSARSVFGDNLKKEDIITTRLAGFRRAWRLKENIKIDNKVIQAIFLDLCQSDQNNTFGILIPLEEGELNRYILREKNYEAIDVTDNILKKPKDTEKIITVISKYKDRLKPKEVRPIPKEYINLVMNGLKNWNTEEVNLFIEEIEKTQLPIIDGKYSFLDPEQSKYT